MENKDIKNVARKLLEGEFERIESLGDNIIAWKGCHPDLVIEDLPEAIRNCITFAEKDKKGIFIQGAIYTNENLSEPEISFSRRGDVYNIKVKESLIPKTSFDVIAFVQRGGHGTCHSSVLDIFEKQGLKTAIFTPQAENFCTRATVFTAKYLDEVGYTTNIREDHSGKMQTSLPTDMKDKKFLLSLLAISLANWDFLLNLCSTEHLIIDSKAEIGTLASIVKKDVNERLKIALKAYTVFEDLSVIPDLDIQSDRELTPLLETAGMGDFGIPNGVQFMMEKVNSIRNQPDATIVFMTMNNNEHVLKRAKEMGFDNVRAIPQISKPIGGKVQSIDLQSKEKIHLLRLNSSIYAQVPELLTLFFKLAELRPKDKFNLIARENQLDIILPSVVPDNFEYLGWSGTNSTLTDQIINSHTFWVHGGNRPSVIEAVHAAGLGVIPFFFTQDRITDNVAKFWGNKDLSIQKILALMMAIETQHERWEIIYSIINKDKLLEKLLINPLKTSIKDVTSVIEELDVIRPKIKDIFSGVDVANTTYLANVYRDIFGI